MIKLDIVVKNIIKCLTLKNNRIISPRQKKIF